MRWRILAAMTWLRSGRARAAAVLALGAAALAAGAGAAVSARHAAPAHPNILVFETDDQRVDELKAMPNTRRLIGDEGVTFDQSFVSYSLCCPSRATFLTGQYAHNHGVLGNKPPNGGYAKLDGRETLPVWLGRAGYTTTHLGKYLNGYGEGNPTEIPPGWQEWQASVDPSTYRYLNFTLNENGTLHDYRGTYKTDLYAEKATEIVRRRAAEEKPFFVWVAFPAPHTGGPREADDPKYPTPAVPRRHRDAFASEPLPRPPSFNERDVSDKPAVIRNKPLLTQRDIRDVQELYQQRLESLLSVDEAIAKVMAALGETGELDDTLVVFTSDNGYFAGEHRVPQGKILLYEPSIRVPLIVRGPGIPHGQHSSSIVANVDLAPTFVDAADATAGRAMDGRSLLPLLANPRTPWRTDLLLETGPSARGGQATYTAVRSSRYLYAEYQNGDRELYDLAKDPYELVSRHRDPAYAAVRKQLAARLKVLRTCAGPTCRT